MPHMLSFNRNHQMNKHLPPPRSLVQSQFCNWQHRCKSVRYSLNDSYALLNSGVQWCMKFRGINLWFIREKCFTIRCLKVLERLHFRLFRKQQFRVTAIRRLDATLPVRVTQELVLYRALSSHNIGRSVKSRRMRRLGVSTAELVLEIRTSCFNTCKISEHSS